MFVLFTGDIITYKIIEGKKDGEVIKEGRISGPDYFEKQEEGRFDRINHMKYSMMLSDNLDLKNSLSEYGSLDIVTRDLFSGL